MAHTFQGRFDDSCDPGEPRVPGRVQRSRYIAGGRGKGEPDTGTSHLGFRAVLTRG